MRLLRIVIVGLMLVGVGCVAKNVRDNIRENDAAQQEYVKRMEAGKTTPEQDKAVIKAQSRNWSAINYYFNGVPILTPTPTGGHQ